MGNQTKIKRVFWDIETSPNIVFTWRIGGKVFIDHNSIISERAVICICYKWEGEKKTRYLVWDNGDDAEMLKEFAEVIKEADEMVAHNGDSFDLKWFNARNLINNLDPVPQPKTVDTLKIARKHLRLNSNRLDYLAKVLFGEGKIKTDFDMWRDITLNHDQKALDKMVRYCKRDVVLLEKVWNKLRDYDAPKTHTAVLASGNPFDRWKCPHCGSAHVKKSKNMVTATGMRKHQMNCLDCYRYYSIADNVFAWYVTQKDG